MIRGNWVVETARTWLGIPFAHQGRNRHGVDCIGFVAAVFDELGDDTFLRNLPPDYARAPRAELLEGLKKFAIQVEAPLPGDIVLIKWPAAAHPSHVAIVTGPTLVHCYQGAGRVVEHGFRAQWARRAHSYWRAMSVYE